MRKIRYLFLLLALLLLAGCGGRQTVDASFRAATQIEVGAEVLDAVSVTLPEGMTRQTVSNIQHDFMQDGKQVGGIVVVDISEDLLESPLENCLTIAAKLGEQVMPDADSESTALMSAGGNAYAYLEVYTGGEQIQYAHYLFRGEANTYDIWFGYSLIDEATVNSILASVSGEDISAELNLILIFN